MLSLTGIYQNGQIKLDKSYSSDSPVKVIVTFLEDTEIQTAKRLSLSDFSFSKSQKDLENYKGSFSDTVIEERRSEL
jgi:hypothetical protein